MTEPRPIERRKDLGMPPGTPIFIGEQQVESVQMSYFQYNEDDFKEVQVIRFEEDFPQFSNDYITWINVIGIHDIDVINIIGNKMGVDPLILEDIVNSSSRPKIEDLSDYYFLILKDLDFNQERFELEQEQFAFLVGTNFVVTFQENEIDLFDKIRDRIRKNKGAIRKSPTDYLFNRLIDTIVDNYYVVVERLGLTIEELENLVITNPDKNTLQTIQDLKSELIYFRRLILPVRELLGIIAKLDDIVVSQTTIVFVRSIFDHLNQVIDQVEIYREMLTGFLEIYLSSISNRTNDVMKVLTIITSIFIPLSFLAGVYGMNFQHMPELQSRIAYPLLWVVFFTIAGCMLYYFRKIGWLSLE